MERIYSKVTAVKVIITSFFKVIGWYIKDFKHNLKNKEVNYGIRASLDTEFALIHAAKKGMKLPRAKKN